jgi:hypothetical protein
VGLNEGLGRLPAESRYQFANSLLLMLALAPLVPRFRLTPLRGALLALVVGAIVVANLGRYHGWEKIYHEQEAVANAQLAAVEVARPAIVDPHAVFTDRNQVGLYWPFTPKAYFAAIDAHGSPVSVRRDLQLAPPVVRLWADQTLLRVEGILGLRGRVRSGTVRPRGLPGFAPPLPAGAGCAVIPEGAASVGYQVVAPPGGLVIRPAAGPHVGVSAARFSDEGLRLSTPLLPGEAVIRTKPDASSVPWRFGLIAPQAVTVCSRAE